MLGDDVLDKGVAHVGDGLGDAVVLHQIDALVEDHLALVVLDVVEFQEVLADIEVAGLDLLLRLLQRLVDPGMDDRLAVLEAEPGQHGVEPVGAEDPHQIVFQRQEEFRASGIALASGSAAQLVVDAPQFMALGADDVEPARPGRGLRRLRALCRLDLDGVLGLQHDVAETFDVGLDALDPGGLLGLVGDAGGLVLDPHFERTAELDVGAAAGHVGRDRDRAGHAGFGHDIGFLLVEARVQHREQLCRLAGARRGVQLLHGVFVAEIDLLVAVLLQIVGEHLGLFDRGGADQHRLQPRIGAFDLGQDRGIFLVLGAVDLVVLVEARHRQIGRDFHDFELVDVEQFVGLGQPPCRSCRRASRTSGNSSGR